MTRVTAVALLLEATPVRPHNRIGIGEESGERAPTGRLWAAGLDREAQAVRA
ncbi:hypothetical protein [Mycobacterium sp. 141]|uniref:hypothetical protein n=1 Tax=Mycobacterium sp. 141 TaxID=1120797 RepID=UPI00036136E6|nr:hypothetical protein [Mycobacterium sp. 141]